MEPIDDSYNSLLCFDFARQKGIYRIELPEPLKAATGTALDQLHQELEERQLGYHEAAKLIACQLLLQINRYVQSVRRRNAPLNLVLAPFG